MRDRPAYNAINRPFAICHQLMSLIPSGHIPSFCVRRLLDVGGSWARPPACGGRARPKGGGPAPQALARRPHHPPKNTTIHPRKPPIQNGFAQMSLMPNSGMSSLNALCLNLTPCPLSFKGEEDRGVRSLKMKLQTFQLLRNLFRPLWYDTV